MKKAYIEVTTRLIINVDEDDEGATDKIMENMDYNFSYKGEEGEVLESEITAHRPLEVE